MAAALCSMFNVYLCIPQKPSIGAQYWEKVAGLISFNSGWEWYDASYPALVVIPL